VLNTITIDPTIMGTQGTASTFLSSAAFGGPVFDPTQVMSIRAAELAPNPSFGPGGAVWNQFPPAPVQTGVPIWNYWSTLTVTGPGIPEPATAGVLALGAIGLLIRRYR
jgi:hypothetical protein